MQTIGLQGSPLSPQQARLWSWQKKSFMHRTLCAVQIQGTLAKERLKIAIECVIERHEILRTTFYTLPGMDVPVQIVGDYDLWSWSEISLELLEISHQSNMFDYLFTTLQKEVCDVQNNSLFHSWLFRFAENRNILVMSLPALCADSSSNKLFIAELARAYAQEALTEEVLQYADVSAWQEDLLHGDETETERQYWRKTNLSQITSMILPFGHDAHHPLPTGNTAFVSDMVAIPLSDELAMQMEIFLVSLNPCLVGLAVAAKQNLEGKIIMPN